MNETEFMGFSSMQDYENVVSAMTPEEQAAVVMVTGTYLAIAGSHALIKKYPALGTVSFFAAVAMGIYIVKMSTAS